MAIAGLTILAWLGSFLGFSSLFTDLGMKSASMEAACLSVVITVTVGILASIGIGVNRKPK